VSLFGKEIRQSEPRGILEDSGLDRGLSPPPGFREYFVRTKLLKKASEPRLGDGRTKRMRQRGFACLRFVQRPLAISHEPVRLKDFTITTAL
jgi:hypothetical protein